MECVDFLVPLSFETMKFITLYCTVLFKFSKYFHFRLLDNFPRILNLRINQLQTNYNKAYYNVNFKIFSAFLVTILKAVSMVYCMF